VRPLPGAKRLLLPVGMPIFILISAPHNLILSIMLLCRWADVRPLPGARRLLEHLRSCGAKVANACSQQPSQCVTCPYALCHCAGGLMSGRCRVQGGCCCQLLTLHTKISTAKPHTEHVAAVQVGRCKATAWGEAAAGALAQLWRQGGNCHQHQQGHF
jgi:hypothetical protein